ncbi:VOC family protein [Brevundimonas sp. S30B]|uniref:VOC family protein n=1 Tax=unclassified Brevundimonas TaxID=2622653 RepID=UPI0010717FA2|nr:MULTISPECIES: VOC family protein [unclassified Brevundimonas]QBX36994.1 VOC family protein [Brevundimonas sp. MF30-B]TFW04210.1 VOC family protein [Brevundimonas sp. S30B]
MKVTPNLMFETQAREAFTAYADILGADQLHLITFADMPDAPVGDDWKDRVAHAWLQIGDQAIMGSDSPPGVCADGQASGTRPGEGSVALHFDTADQARCVFDRLADGGTVQMPFGPTSWTSGFGMVRDRFGKDWMVNTNQETPS